MELEITPAAGSAASPANGAADWTSPSPTDMAVQDDEVDTAQHNREGEDDLRQQTQESEEAPRTCVQREDSDTSFSESS